MAVDANQKGEGTARMAKIKHTCTGTQSACLNFDEAYQLLDRRLLSQTKYGLNLSQYNPKECKPMTVLINGTFLPLLNIHRKMKREVVWGPLKMGGLGLNTKLYSLQCQCAVNALDIGGSSISVCSWTSRSISNIIEYTTGGILRLAVGGAPLKSLSRE
jgi:hypothetical protein